MLTRWVANSEVCSPGGSPSDSTTCGRHPPCQMTHVIKSHRSTEQTRVSMSCSSPIPPVLGVWGEVRASSQFSSQSSLHTFGSFVFELASPRRPGPWSLGMGPTIARSMWRGGRVASRFGQNRSLITLWFGLNVLPMRPGTAAPPGRRLPRICVLRGGQS